MQLLHSWMQISLHIHVWVQLQFVLHCCMGGCEVFGGAHNWTVWMRLVSIPSTLHRCSPFSVSFAVQFTCLDGQPDTNSLSSGSPPSTFGLVDEIECKSSCSDHRLETQKQSAAPLAGIDSSPSKRSSCTARRRLLRQASAASKRIRFYRSLYFSI